MKDVEVSLCPKDLEVIPKYATEHASGADLFAFIQEKMDLVPGASVLVPTGLRVEIPVGYEIQIRPRSGHAFHHQVTVLNTPGTIDADYRGEIGVILINHGKKIFQIFPKMKIAQMVLVPVCRAVFVIKDELVATQRGEGGFGHTGE